LPRTGTFTYAFDAGDDMAVAVARLSDLSNHADLHPLIVAVRPAPPPPGALRRFVITDRMAVGPAHFRITYTTDLLTVTDDTLILVARQRPATTLHNHTHLSHAGDRIRADVEITMTAPTLLFPYAFDQAQRAHLALADRLTAAFRT
jgi:hypothetical protein